MLEYVTITLLETPLYVFCIRFAWHFLLDSMPNNANSILLETISRCVKTSRKSAYYTSSFFWKISQISSQRKPHATPQNTTSFPFSKECHNECHEECYSNLSFWTHFDKVFLIFLSHLGVLSPIYHQHVLCPLDSLPLTRHASSRQFIVLTSVYLSCWCHNFAFHATHSTTFNRKTFVSPDSFFFDILPENCRAFLSAYHVFCAATSFYRYSHSRLRGDGATYWRPLTNIFRTDSVYSFRTLFDERLVLAYADTECTRGFSREAIVDAGVNIISYSCIFSLPQPRLCVVPEWDGKGGILTYCRVAALCVQILLFWFSYISHVDYEMIVSVLSYIYLHTDFHIAQLFIFFITYSIYILTYMRLRVHPIYSAISYSCILDSWYAWDVILCLGI